MTWQAGLGPTTMAVDEPMARAYVVNKLAYHGPRPVAVSQSEWQFEWQRPVQLLVVAIDSFRE